MKKQETRTDHVFAGGNSPSSMTEQMIQDALSKLRRDLGSSQKSLDSVLEQFRGLRTELNELRSYYLGLKSDVDRLSVDTGNLRMFQAKLGDVDTRLDKLEGDTGDLKNDLSNLRSVVRVGLSTAFDTVYSLKTDLGKLSGEVDQLDKDTEELKKGVSNVTYALKVGLSTVVDRIVGLKADVDKSAANIEELQTGVIQLAGTEGALSTHVENVLGTIKELWGHVQEFEKVVERRHLNFCNSIVPMYSNLMPKEVFKNVSQDLQTITVTTDPKDARFGSGVGDYYILRTRPN
jgi:chromosome segregation ATPase